MDRVYIEPKEPPKCAICGRVMTKENKDNFRVIFGSLVCDDLDKDCTEQLMESVRPILQGFAALGGRTLY